MCSILLLAGNSLSNTCCKAIQIQSGLALDRDISGVYTIKETEDGGIVHERADGQFCTMNINHWMVETCDHGNPAGSIGFIHALPSVRPECPSEVRRPN